MTKLDYFSLLLDIASLNWGVACNESLFCETLKGGGWGGGVKQKNLHNNVSIKVKPSQCNSKAYVSEIKDSFLHAIFSFWYELNKSGNFSKMGTLVCLSRNPSCSYEA